MDSRDIAPKDDRWEKKLALVGLSIINPVCSWERKVFNLFLNEC